MEIMVKVCNEIVMASMCIKTIDRMARTCDLRITSPALYVSCATAGLERGGEGGGKGSLHYDTSRRPILLSHNLVSGISISDFQNMLLGANCKIRVF